MKLKKRLKKVFIVVLSAIVTGFIGISGFLGYQVANQLSYQNVSKNTIEASIMQLKSWGKTIDYYEENYEHKTLFLENEKGYQIPYTIIGDTKLKERDTVILVHGAGGDYRSVYPHAEFYVQQGYNVVAIDQRASGLSKDNIVSFGYYEKYDLEDMVDFITEMLPQQKIILHGFSMGAATVALYGEMVGEKESILLMVLDSSYESMQYIFAKVWEGMDTGLPSSYAAFCGNIFLKTKFGYSFDDVNVIKALERCKIPVLFFQGTNDDLTTPDRGKNLYEHSAAKQKEYVEQECGHIEGFVKHPNEYKKRVLKFIDEIRIDTNSKKNG